jgi:hypothetical protein
VRCGERLRLCAKIFCWRARPIALKLRSFRRRFSDVEVNRAAKSFQIKVWSASLLSIKQLCAKATPSRRDFSQLASRFS